MTVKRSGLGRNLSALLGGVTPQSLDSLPSSPPLVVSSRDLQPGKYQPRRTFNEETLKELAQSIQQQGLLQPIVVRPIGQERYEILAGERRWRACKLAGLQDIPVIVKTVTDEEALVIALVENLQREDLNVLESARAMDQLMRDYALTHQQVADLLSKSRSNVSNQLRLLSLALPVQQYLEQGNLEMGHARALLMLEEPLQTEAACMVTEKQLSVRATEALVARLKAGDVTVEAFHTPQMTHPFEQLLNECLKTKVEIKPGRAGRGKLVIHYDNEASLGFIVESLKKESV
jgi:ParB family transcriptional regulator, chromosome partitioning protein